MRNSSPPKKKRYAWSTSWTTRHNLRLTQNKMESGNRASCEICACGHANKLGMHLLTYTCILKSIWNFATSTFYPVISTYFWIAELRILQSILDITLFKDRQVVLNILLLAIVLLDQVSTELTCAEGVEKQMPWYKSWSLMSSPSNMPSNAHYPPPKKKKLYIYIHIKVSLVSVGLDFFGEWYSGGRTLRISILADHLTAIDHIIVT